MVLSNPVVSLSHNLLGIHSLAGQFVAQITGYRGSNVAVASDGTAGGMGALALACRLLQSDEADRVIVVGASAPADAATLWKRLQSDATTAERRPPLAGGGLTEVKQVLLAREPLYRECAHWSVSTANRSPMEAVDDVLAHLQKTSA